MFFVSTIDYKSTRLPLSTNADVTSKQTTFKNKTAQKMTAEKMTSELTTSKTPEITKEPSLTMAATENHTPKSDSRVVGNTASNYF